jgi:hypothetical protein
MMRKLCAVMAMMMLVSLFAVQFAVANPQAMSGKVVEHMDSGGYTYIHIESNGTKTWVAVPKAKVEKGQTVSFLQGMWMVNFKSKTLDRTFEKIYFSEGLSR